MALGVHDTLNWEKIDIPRMNLISMVSQRRNGMEHNHDIAFFRDSLESEDPPSKLPAANV